jgi:uncharacterized hydrophobic protein (TIGR00271 family)
MSPAPSHSLAPVIALHRLWRRLRGRLAHHVDHAAVIDNVADAGGWSPRFAFMAVMSCGIAILGLLQSSAAVVIGAMLISPLMGPIVQLGFSLCVVDFRMMGRALLALLAGVLLALATAMSIVWLSPLREATSEILARTQPTLFDLLVAILSGLAGGYAVITRKGEAIVGVAIATALMPPLAVVAFGLATGDVGIAGGAFFLFMTNLLAIALSVTLIAKWYGFGVDNSPKHSVWQAIVIATTFVLLALPLGLALRNIGEQTWTANQTRAVVQKYLQERGGSIEQIRVERHGQGYAVDLVAMVPAYIGNAQAELAARLAARLPKVPAVRVRQTLEANDDGRRDRADLDGLRLRVNALSEQTRQLRAEADAWTLEHVRTRLGDITAEVMLDGMQKRIVVTLPPAVSGADAALDADAMACLRERLGAATPGWSIEVVGMHEPAPAIVQTANAGDGKAEVPHAVP